MQVKHFIKMMQMLSEHPPTDLGTLTLQVYDVDAGKVVPVEGYEYDPVARTVTVLP